MSCDIDSCYCLSTVCHVTLTAVIVSSGLQVVWCLVNPSLLVWELTAPTIGTSAGGMELVSKQLLLIMVG